MVFLGRHLMEGQWRAYLERGPHKLTLTHVPLFWEKFSFMVEKGQWVILPNSVTK